MRHTDASVVRALIAARWLDQEGESRTLGTIVLRDHQAEAVARLRSAMAEFRGALLADAVGLGKTYVALKIAADARRPLVIAPAALRDMWRAAAAAADVRIEILSHESLSASRARRGHTDHDLLIVDEAHHARNPSTRRYRSLAELAARVPVLLMSATPVHNRARDLAAILALFLGARAWTLTPAELGRCIVRREHDTLSSQPLPKQSAPAWIPLTHDDAMLDRLLALAPPMPPSDGGDGGALLAHALIRRWASSDAALRATLRRRLGQATAMAAALGAGRYPSRSELRSWTQGDFALQLSFADILAAGSAPPDARALRDAVARHADGVLDVLQSLGEDRHDAERAERLTELRERHAGEKIVAFTVFAETASALFRQLRAKPRVAMLTARGARIASGPVTREDVLSRFAPRASGVRQPHAREAIDLLIATDLLSEGVNLQDASVAVHLDLPWTPARLEQRVGRIVRFESAHARVRVYALAPPASAEAFLGVERLLRDKLCAARRALGIAGTILPGPGIAPLADSSAPSAHERLRTIVREWSSERISARCARDPLVAAVRAGQTGFLALLGAPPHRPLLIGALGGPADDAPHLLARVAECACGAGMAVDATELARALARIAMWRRSARAEREVELQHAASARARRSVLRRIASIAQSALPDRRATIMALAEQARHAAIVPCGVGAERILADLAGAPLSDEAWLTAVGAFGDLHARAGHEFTEPELRALILLQ